MSAKKLSQCGLFVAFIAVCAWLSLPLFGIPVTMQSFAVALGLLILGGKWDAVAVLVYLCLGAMGLPVFSGFGGGIGVLLGPAGGYLWGFLAGALGYWGVTALGKSKILGLALFQALCYACGVFWYLFGYGAQDAVFQVLLTAVLPFLLPDGAKLTLAYFLARRLSRHIS